MEMPTMLKTKYSSSEYQPDMMASQIFGEAARNLHKEINMAKTQRRIAQVFIVDKDPNIPLDKALLYQGEPKFTDATDQELFFELDVKGILDDHNIYRTTVKIKDSKDGDTLEPARIRDLSMVVVDIATF